jgi:hypothetical protein
MNIIYKSGLAIAVLTASGCANTTSDDDYGQSVKQIVQAQTLDPAAASNPPELAPEITDGARLQNALDVYRKDVAKGNTEVKQPVIFEVGTH